eukprot:1252243-Alexandrium_andersonii.AAC.1
MVLNSDAFKSHFGRSSGFARRSTEIQSACTGVHRHSPNTDETHISVHLNLNNIHLRAGGFV